MFRFKQFVIEQNRCAMKVSTDGILFGSWCHPESPSRILDIGTGTGLLSLMLAQKTPDNTEIVSIEIESDAAAQAQQNVRVSPWPDKIQVMNTSIQKFASKGQTSFDVIISNPPWFEYSPSASHNSENQIRQSSRTLARQQTGLTLSQLLEISEQLLAVNGELYLLLPSLAESHLLCLVAERSLQLTTRCDVHASYKHPVHCQMWCFRKGSHPVTKSNTTMMIKDQHQSYSQEFREICKDYYLNF